MPTPNALRPRRRSAGQRERGLGSPAASGRSPSDGMPGFAARHEGARAGEFPLRDATIRTMKSTPGFRKRVALRGAARERKPRSAGARRGFSRPAWRQAGDQAKAAEVTTAARGAREDVEKGSPAWPNAGPALCSCLSARGARTRKRSGPWLAAAPTGLTPPSGGGGGRVEGSNPSGLDRAANGEADPAPNTRGTPSPRSQDRGRSSGPQGTGSRARASRS